MEIKVPKWATTIKDEGVLTFVAFADRMCRLNGFDTTYTLHIDDLVRITNKRSGGLLDWLREFPEISDNIEVGKLYDTVVCFSLKKPVLKQHKHAGRPKKEYMYPIELKEDRQKFIWMYLLGCLNQNLITGEDPKDIAKRNAFDIKEFHISREAQAYVKKADR
tara:strand:- start:110 stop:598 length:489 start_codon:yes stop_codon:yes gene_type:complete